VQWGRRGASWKRCGGKSTDNIIDRAEGQVVSLAAKQPADKRAIRRPRNNVLRAVVQAICAADPLVRDVVLIGSAVYAQDLAVDYDLVVTTRSAEPDNALFERLLAAANAVSDKPVDIIIRRPGAALVGLAQPIVAGRVLMGRRATTNEASASLKERGGLVNSFAQAEAALVNAEDLFQHAIATADPAVRDRRYRNAFNELFDAARIAALAYIGSKTTRWGRAADALPSPYGQEFRDMIATLHVAYSYDGRYPHDEQAATKEFIEWKDRVSRFVAALRNMDP